MAEILHVFRVVLKLGYFIGFTILFYVSLEKCFLSEGQSKRKLLVLSIVTSPVVTYIVAFGLGELFYEFLDFLKVGDEPSNTTLIIAGFFFGMLYLALILLCVRLFGKWIK